MLRRCVVTTAVQHRRITPAARLILPATADRDTWLAERRKGVGSSDVTNILGLHGSQLTVWHEKLGHLPELEQNEPMLWGTLFEDTVAQEWARRNRSVVRRVGLVANIAEPYLRATLDRRVVECPLNRDRRESCGLEVKCRNAFGSGKWGKSGIPDDVLAQVLHQMHVTGYDHMHVAVLIGGNDYRQRTIHAAKEAETLEWSVEQSRRFWLDYVVPRRRPPHNGDGDELLDLEDRLHPNRVGVKDLDISEYADAQALLSEYAEQHVVEKAAAERKKLIQGELITLLDGAEDALADNNLLYQYAEMPGRAKANLDRLAEKYPDAYADCVSTGKPYRRFNPRLPRKA
jgi:putative phage-type endonuclease